MAVIPIYIPTYISDQTYNPCRVQPRLLFFNGMIDCEPYYIESASAFAGVSKEQTAFPYFDNYNVVSGSFPTTDSDSLLFYNETPVYGELPDETLYSKYWTNYVQLIYNPRTRLLNASTIIPLADYFKMELNDIVELRGNYYHLRAINDYNLKNGECRVQLLGPILPDAVTFIAPTTTSTTTTSTSTTSTTTTSTSTTSTSTTTSTTSTSTTTSSTTTTTAPTTATLSWSFTESIGSSGYMDIYVNASVIESRVNTSSGTYNLQLGDTINVQVACFTCGSPNTYANAYSFSNRLILADAACMNNGEASILTANYTVVSGDIGNTITLDTFARCDSGCI